jgi:hypothetical protein
MTVDDSRTRQPGTRMGENALSIDNLQMRIGEGEQTVRALRGVSLKLPLLSGGRVGSDKG